MEFETQNGHLMWDGCDTVALAEKFGTPLYVFSQTMIEEKMSGAATRFCRKIRKCTSGLCE